MNKLILLFLLLVAHSKTLFSQNGLIVNTEGMPPITTYVGTDYNGFNQVWDIIQSDRGLIYIATSYGLHEFDGSQWRKIEIDEGLVPRCFAKSKSGKIYLGGIGIIGYLSVDPIGNTKFQSLAGLLPEGVLPGRQEFMSILDSKVFFSGFNSILVYDEMGDSLQYFSTKKRSYPNFVLKDKVYFKYDGLLSYENDTLIEVESGSYFSGKAISDFMVYPGDSLIALSPSHEFHFFDGDTAYHKSYFTDPYLKEKFPYKLLNLSEKYNAICYLSAGLVITDRYWNPILHIDESAGINQQVYKAYLDAEYNLWLATNFGVSVVELASKFSSFDLSTGISGDITDFMVKDDQLFVASTTGIYYKAWGKDQMPVQRKNQLFKKVENSDIYNDDLLANSSPVLVKAYQTIGQIVHGKYRRLYTKSETQSELTYLQDSSYVLAIGKNGSSMQLFHHDGEEWVHERSLENSVLPERIHHMKFDPENQWVWGSNATATFSFKISEDMQSIDNVVTYSSEDGLPSAAGNSFMEEGNKIMILTQKGLYQFNRSIKRFNKSDFFQNKFENKGLVKLSKENDSAYWYITSSAEIGKIEFSGDSVHVNSKLAKPMAVNANNVYYSAKKGALYGATNSIGFFEDDKKENYDIIFAPMIRQLDIISGQDTTIFYGRFLTADSTFSWNQSNPIKLTYEQNGVRFSYAIPYYRHPDLVQYKLQLNGYEDEWSDWTPKTQKEYTNLEAGKYEFRIKAKNGFDKESKVGFFQFEVLPPWYQTWWAYLMYGLIGIGILKLIIGMNSKRLKIENIKLEETIRVRVKEIEDQKSVIAQSLIEKESLLKEIHHRVKNNLQIIASLLYLQSGKFENEDFKRVLEEGQGRVRSMALIHQKLYENDDLKSIPFNEYLSELVGEIRSSFGMNKVKLNIQAENIYFDVDTAVPLGLIVNELATNAFKYAFEGSDQGSFSISLTKNGDVYSLNIKDDGVGMPDEIDIKKTRSLGLRLVRMLSQQLEGQFTFEGHKGTTFKLNFAA